MTFIGLPSNVSPRLKAIHGCQLGVVGLTMVATFLAAVIPQKHKSFTFGLLYPLILTSFSTTFLLYREQRRALNGTLTKDRYIKYQLFKLFAAFGLSFIGFFLDFFTEDGTCDPQRVGEQGLWIRCIKVNKWQGMIMWLNFFNWVFLWAGVFYSCCMSRNREGAIALGGEEARIGLNDETANDEAIARNLQAQDPNWRA